MLRAYQDELDTMFKELGWQYWELFQITARLGEEVGEVGREIGHRYGGKKKRDDEPDGDLEEEIGDVIYTLICFANSKGYDINQSIMYGLRESIAYESGDPLEIYAELFNRTGIFVGKAKSYHKARDATVKPPDSTVAAALGNIFRVLSVFVNQTGCTLDHAFHKSISKVMKRDKDRFPDGI